MQVSLKLFPRLRVSNIIKGTFLAGDIERARNFQQESVEIVRIIIRHGGGVRGGKAIMNYLGIDCGNCRPPFAPYTKTEMHQLGEELSQIGFTK